MGRAYARKSERMFNDSGSRYTHLLECVRAMAGGIAIGFNKPQFLSLKQRGMKVPFVTLPSEQLRWISCRRTAQQVHCLFQRVFVCFLVSAVGLPVVFLPPSLFDCSFLLSQALALSHFLKEKGCYPSRVKDPSDIAQFFFQACAMELNIQQLAVIAGTLAGVGVCPTTAQQVRGRNVPSSG